MLSFHKSIIIAITGASGTVYGLSLLKQLLIKGFKVDVVFSNNALKVSKLELEQDWESLNITELKNRVLDYIFKETSSLYLVSSSLAEEEGNTKFGVRQECHCEDLTEIKSRVSFWHESNIAAPIASGSYQAQAMIVSPCSMGTLANIAMGTSHNLISRSADVMLKERKKLILLVRETPFSTIHLRNMLSLSEAGAIIMPAIPAFYHKPETITDQVNFITGKMLDLLGIESDLFKRWLC